MMVSAGHVTQSATLAQESLELARELSNGPDIIRALYWLAVTQSYQGNAEQAMALFEESLVLAREQGDKRQIGNIQLILGRIVLHQGDLLQAETSAQESLLLFRELGTEEGAAQALALVGDIRRIQGDLTQAREICKEGILLARKAGYHYSLGWSLISLARVTAAEGQLEQAARLFGTAEPWLNPSTEMDPADCADYERAVKRVRAQLGEKVFAAAWAEGQRMTLEQAIATQSQAAMPLASLIEMPSAPLAKSSPLYPDGLTVREVEVLCLVAQGLTDAQVAQKLVISPRTVNSHLKAIYGKIQVSSRSAATAYALKHHLV